MNEGKNKKNNYETTKKYIFVCENLNYGIKEEDEKHLIRYDLKGSTLNRFVINKTEKEAINKDKDLSLLLSPKAS